MSPIVGTTLLIVLLQVLCVGVASTLSGILAQDTFPEWENETIASIVVLIAAILNAFVIGLMTGDLAIIVGTVCGIATILLNTSMKPLQRWTKFLQSNLLVVKDGHVTLFPPEEDVSVKVTKPIMTAIKPIQLPEVPKTVLPPATPDDRK